jgi:hypothetical protein
MGGDRTREIETPRARDHEARWEVREHFGMLTGCDQWIPRVDSSQVSEPGNPFVIFGLDRRRRITHGDGPEVGTVTPANVVPAPPETWQPHRAREGRWRETTRRPGP